MTIAAIDCLIRFHVMYPEANRGIAEWLLAARRNIGNLI